MEKSLRALGVCLGLWAVWATGPAMGVTTVVNEDFEGGLPGEVPTGWVSLGGTANFAPGISDTRANVYGNYFSGQTMALTNPEVEPSTDGVVGVIFYENPVDIENNKLLIEFDLLVSPGTTATPADGSCVMVIPKIPTATGATGGGMGWSGLGGFAVEFDIYDNGDPDPDDLVGQTEYQIMVGEPVEGNTLANPAARQVGVDVARYQVNADAVYSIITEDAEENLAVYPNVPDFLAPYDLGSTIVVHVWIEYDNGFIKVDMEVVDDVYPEFDFPRDTVLEGSIGPWAFHNEDCPEEAYVGFAGSTGGSNALQEVDNLVIQLDPNLGEPQYHPDIPPFPAPPEVDPAGKVAEVGAATQMGWNVFTVKLNEESGQTFASFDTFQRLYKTHWVLDHTPPTGSETTLLVNYASGVNAANANLFTDEVGYPGLEFMPLDPPAEAQIDNFGVRATGYIEFPVPGVYYLGTCHDDNFTTFIGGQRIAQALGTGNPTLYKVDVPEAGIYPIQIDLAEQGYYSYFSVFQTDGCGGAFTLINDGTQVKVYTEVPGGTIPPTNYDALNIATADPAEKVGEVGQGTNPGFLYDYRLLRTDVPFDINSHVDAAMLFGVNVPTEAFTIMEDGVVQVVNWNGTAVTAGNQPGDVALPGGDGDDQAIRVQGFAEFPTAGMYALFVNSDDGFEAGIGSQQLMTAGNKGASDVPAFVIIEEPGLYPLEVTWYERGGGNNFEFVQWTDTGAALVNSAASTVKVYQNAPGEGGAVFLPSAYQIEMAAPAGSCLDPGFNVRFVKHPGGVGNLTQCEELLAGLRPITSENLSVQPLLDFWSSGGQGNFESGVPYPTLQPDVDDNHFAIEVTGFIELTAGWHMFGFNSDDGFGLDIGGRRVCEFVDGRGVADTNGSVYIPQTGIYELRVAHWEGEGGAAGELYYINPDATFVLVNDTANGAPAVCVAVEGGGGGEAPVITSIEVQGGNVVVTWEGGTAPYQVQVADTIGGAWSNIGAPTNDTTATIPADGAAGFIRVVPGS